MPHNPMQKNLIAILAAMILAVLPALPAAAGHRHESPSPGQANTGVHSGNSGQHIHETAIDGYRLTYRLIDMRKAMSEMKEKGHDMQSTATHHLMLYITDAAGKAVTGARVGFLIEGAGPAGQKVMAMGMAGGYGADVRLAEGKKHTIKAKAVAGEKTLIDSFVYRLD